MQIGWQIPVIDALFPPRCIVCAGAIAWRKVVFTFFFTTTKKGGKFKITRLKCQGTCQNKKGGRHTPSF